MYACFATVVVISVMLIDRWLPSCVAFLHSLIMNYLLVLLSHWSCLIIVHVGWSCSSVHDQRRLPSTVDRHFSFAVNWLSDYSVMVLMCSCMIFIADASDHVML